MASGWKKSGAPCGPYSTPICQALPYSGINSAGAACGCVKGCAAALSASSGRTTGSMSPTRRVRPAWPPNWPSAKVERLPR
ncbi:hypothetical protein D3C85_1383000 [compost metagenome]